VSRPSELDNKDFGSRSGSTSSAPSGSSSSDSDLPDDLGWFTTVTTGTARYAQPYYEVGIGYGVNGPLATYGALANIPLTGLRMAENFGYVARMLVGTLVAMGQSDSQYVGSTYGYNYRIDYYRPLTAAEKAAQAEQLQAALEGNYVMELTVYTPDMLGLRSGRPQASGFEFYLGGMEPLDMVNDLPSVLQIAFTLSHVKAHRVPYEAGEGAYPDDENLETIECDDGQCQAHRASIYYTNIGLMVRGIVPLNTYLEAFLQWDLNVLTLFDIKQNKLASDGYVWTSPLRLGVTANATDRFYARAWGSINGFGAHGLGGLVEAGLRF
jgi:hypothetical protein